jgi:hypothetical protein
LTACAEFLEDDDVRDAVGELVNVIGGNLKALLPGDTAISTPLVFTSPRLSLARSSPFSKGLSSRNLDRRTSGKRRPQSPSLASAVPLA